jgi:TonB family protein
MILRTLLALGFFIRVGFGFQPSAPVTIGPGVTRPTLTRKIEPGYTEMARAAQVQGTVVLEIVVGETGLAEDIAVISPLGFGLDEMAVDTVSRWRFKPGMKDGKPVRILANVEVNFVLGQGSTISKNEKQRTAFNLVLRAVQQGHITPKTVESVQKLAEAKYAPGMYLYATLLNSGNGVPMDVTQSVALIKEAADKDFAPALLEMGQMLLVGNKVPKNQQKGLEHIRRAATAGSLPAQVLMGNLYEQGGDVGQDLEKSRQFFRLCAASGEHVCQFRLGASLLARPDRQEREYIQGMAWLELAAEQQDADAEALVAKERPGLKPEQISRIESLKPQLVKKH